MLLWPNRSRMEVLSACLCPSFVVSGSEGNGGTQVPFSSNRLDFGEGQVKGKGREVMGG